MKKFVLLIAIFCAPCTLYADGGVGFSNNTSGGYTITSSEILTKKFLPWDSDVFSEAVIKKINQTPSSKEVNDVLKSRCILDVDWITDEIIEGKFKIPFSAQDLLALCRKHVWPEHYMSKYDCNNACKDFTFYYMQTVIEKPKKERQQKVHDYIWNKK